MSHIFDEFEEQLDVGLIFQTNTTANARKRLLKYEKICSIINHMRMRSAPSRDTRVVERRDAVVDIVVNVPKKVTGSSEQRITVYYT